MIDNDYKPRLGGYYEAGHTEAIDAHDNDYAISSYAVNLNKTYGLQSNLGYLYKNKIMFVLRDGEPRTVKQISKELLMPLPEVQQALMLMCKLNEIERIEETLYRLKRA